MLGVKRPSGETKEELKIYEEFMRNFETGRNQVAAAVSIEEKIKSSQDKQEMVSAAEKYKFGIKLLKAAQEVQIMGCHESKRRDVHLNKEKAAGYIKSSEERFLELTRQLGISSSTGTTRTDGPRPSSVTGHNRQSPARVKRASSSVRGSLLRNNPFPLKRDHRKTIISNPSPRPSSLIAIAPSRDALLKGVDKKFGEALLDEMLESTGIRLADVAGAESAKKALEEAVILPAINPALFSGLRQPVKGILLFGPPGNGKTMLAKAVATESGQIFFNISASALTSKWVGDSEKTVRCLFQIARNAQPSIIFIDEIDSILCERNSKEADASRRLKTEFLVQFDGATTSAEDRILVIGATNRPHELDDAVLRRFPKRIMLGLPDEKARAALIKATLKRHKADSGLSDSDIRLIASRTENYSNSDLVSLCKEAAMVPVRSISRSKLAGVDEESVRPIKYSDFTDALKVIKPSTNDRVLEEMKEFAQRAGQVA